MSLIAAMGATLLISPSARTSSVPCPKGSTLDVVAHEDDSLLFMSPDIERDIQAGRCVRTVFVTAGDHGMGASYYRLRELGAEAAYAEMASVPDTWTRSDAGIRGDPMQLMTLRRDPRVSLVFMRLPDGDDGSGFPSNHYESLQKLYTGSISRITAVDGSSSYTDSGLIRTLSLLMRAFGPDRIDTQDFVGDYGDGDHSDHHTVAYLTRDAHHLFTLPHTLVGYIGYPGVKRPANVAGRDLGAKLDAWWAYALYDRNVCQSVTQCERSNTWLQLHRQYVVGSESGGPGSGGNLATQAMVTASSQNTSTGQLAVRAVDGVIGGYPRDPTHEWATVGGRAGSWLKLTWSRPQKIAKVVLYDRPNLSDQITSAILTFSGGRSVPVPALYNDGDATAVTFPAIRTRTLMLTVTSVSARTLNIGLAEIQTY